MEASHREAGDMLDVKGNKKMVQQHFYRKSGKMVTLKDLHNLASKNKKNEIVNVNTLIEEMKKINGKFTKGSL